MSPSCNRTRAHLLLTTYYCIPLYALPVTEETVGAYWIFHLGAVRNSTQISKNGSARSSGVIFTSALLTAGSHRPCLAPAFRAALLSPSLLFLSLSAIDSLIWTLYLFSRWLSRSVSGGFPRFSMLWLLFQPPFFQPHLERFWLL